MLLAPEGPESIIRAHLNVTRATAPATNNCGEEKNEENDIAKER